MKCTTICFKALANSMWYSAQKIAWHSI